MKHYIDKRIQRSTSAFKEALISCLAEKPFYAITVSEIIEKSTYNRSTFYAHFESKEQLLQVIIDDTLHTMIEQIRYPYKDLESVDMHTLNAQSITLYQYFLDNKQLYKLLLSNHIQVDFRHQLANAIEQLFIQEYEYEIASSTLSTKWLYVFRASGIAGMIVRWIEEDFQEPPHEMAEQVLELLLVPATTFRVKLKRD